MDSQTLHILNGDATFASFEGTNLEGDTLIWREVFSEGPVGKELNANFWKVRAEWIGKTFGAPIEQYLQWEKTELSKINEPYPEINLWFEFDLHCQLNLLGVMQLLKQQTDLTERAIYLISPDSFPGIDDFRGMGQLNSDQLESLFDTRIQLAEYDFTLAAEAWDLYVEGNAGKLKSWIDDTLFWGSLHNLKRAMQAYLKRIEVNSEGHNYIEQKLLDIYNSGTTFRAEIYAAFWKEEAVYGMGDKELDSYLDKLGIN